MKRASSISIPIVCSILAALASLPALGQGLIVKDVAVYLVDQYGEKLNDASLFESTWPVHVSTRRDRASGADRLSPAPAGFLSLEGSSTGAVDVVAEVKGGRILSTWPQAEITRNRMLLRELAIQDSSEGAEPLPEGHWWNRMRSNDSNWIVRGGQAEAGVYYDVEIPYTPAVEISVTNGNFHAVNKGVYPVHSITMYDPAGDGGWRMGSLDALNGQSAPPPDKPKPADPGSVEFLFENPPPNEESSAKPEAETSSPETKPALTSQSMEMSETAIGAVSELTRKWTDELSALGFDERQARLAVSVIEKYALDSEQAMLVYRLDPAQLDELVQLDVTPAPAKQIRAAIVIVQNADPNLKQRIAELIGQLGDASWKKRESASAELKTLMKAAKPLLQEAVNHDDLEIVFRAERLLEENGINLTR